MENPSPKPSERLYPNQRPEEVRPSFDRPDSKTRPSIPVPPTSIPSAPETPHSESYLQPDRSPREQSGQETEGNQPPETESGHQVNKQRKAVYAGVAAVLLLGAGVGSKMFGGKTDPSSEQEAGTPVMSLTDGQSEKGSDQKPKEKIEQSTDHEDHLTKVPPIPPSEVEKTIHGQSTTTDEFSQLLQKASNQRLTEHEIDRLRTLRDKEVEQMRERLQKNVLLSRNRLEDSVELQRERLQRETEAQRNALEAAVEKRRMELESRIEEMRRISEESINRSRLGHRGNY